VFGVGAFKDGVAFAAECVSGTSCTQAVSIGAAHVVFKMVGVCRDCSVALCVDPEKAHCIEY